MLKRYFCFDLFVEHEYGFTGVSDVGHLSSYSTPCPGDEITHSLELTGEHDSDDEESDELDQIVFIPVSYPQLLSESASF